MVVLSSSCEWGEGDGKTIKDNTIRGRLKALRVMSHEYVQSSTTGVVPTATCGPVITGLYREVAALHSDHYRQVPLVGAGCFRQVAAFRATTIDRSH